MKRVKTSTIATIIGLLAGMFLLYFVIGQDISSGIPLTLSQFFYAHAAGYLFFIISPVEILFVHGLNIGLSPLYLTIAALIGAVGAQIIDYAIGLLFSKRFIEEIISVKKYQKYKAKIETHGGWIILLFNLLPLSSPILVLVAGMLRYNFKKTILYSLIGLILKYIIIAIIITQFNYNL